MSPTFRRKHLTDLGLSVLAILLICWNLVRAGIGPLASLAIPVGFVALACAHFFLRGVERRALVFFVALAALWVGLEFARGGDHSYPVFFFFAPVLGYALSRVDAVLLRRVAIGFLAVQLGAEVVESVSGSYIFVVQSSFSDLSLDERLFAGAAGDFRAKGLLEGPTTVGAVVIFLGLIFHRSWPVLLLGLACVALALARLGALVIVLLIFWRIWSHVAVRGSVGLRKVIASAGVAIIVIVPTSLALSQPTGTFGSALDVGSARNVARVGYWVAAARLFQSYPAMDKLVGQPGRYRAEMANSPESAWLNLMVEGGVVLLAVYGLGLFVRRGAGVDGLVTRGLCVASGALVTLFASLPTLVLYWTYCWTVGEALRTTGAGWGRSA